MSSFSSKDHLFNLGDGRSSRSSQISDPCPCMNVIRIYSCPPFFADVPNSGRGLPRLGYRQQWNKDFLNYITKLNAKKPVIYCGDLNVAHEAIGEFKQQQNNREHLYYD